MKHRPWLAAAAAGALLVPATAAQAATKTVTIGPPKGALPGVKGPAYDASLYPSRIIIAAGDKLDVKATGGFGDVTYVAKGDKLPSFVAEADALISGAKDAAGADMWFNGQHQLAPNPAILAPSGTKIDGSKTVTSGLLGLGPAKKWTVTFPKKGTYTLRSSVHPGVSLKVTVKPRHASVPSAKQDAKRVKQQLKGAAKLAKKLLAAKGPSGAVIQAGSDAKGVATIAFYPAQKTVKVGEPVTFQMSKHSIEFHNIALGPEDYIGEQAQRFFGEFFDPFVVYRSEQPGTAISYDGSNHGNGFVNTGAIDANKATPFPSKETITFSKPGTYTYYCVVHGGEMRGTITVN